jgi:hypothetical protein
MILILYLFIIFLSYFFIIKFTFIEGYFNDKICNNIFIEKTKLWIKIKQ